MYNITAETLSVFTYIVYKVLQFEFTVYNILDIKTEIYQPKKM